MDTFFDLREFMITFLRKAKLCIIVTILCAGVGASVRFIPLMVDYITFKEPDLVTAQETMSEFPYMYQTRRTIFIEPQYTTIDDNIIDSTSVILNAYFACYQNKEILQPLVEKYFTEAANDNVEYREKLVQYNYRTKSVLEDIFTLNDFYKLITIKSVGGSGISDTNYINIYATTGNEEFSEVLVQDAERLITQYVNELVGEFTYKVTEGQVGMILPQATDGLIPKMLSSNSNNTTISRPTISYIIKRSMKGAIWGLGAGVGASILIAFFFNCLSLVLISENELKEYEIPTIGTIKKMGPKKMFRFINHWIDILEGNNHACDTYQDAARLIAAYIRASGSQSENPCVLLTGCCNTDILNTVSEQLQVCANDMIVMTSGCITNSADTVELLKSVTDVVLVEQLGKSNKNEIHKEIERIQYLKKCIVGIILQK